MNKLILIETSYFVILFMPFSRVMSKGFLNIYALCFKRGINSQHKFIGGYVLENLLYFIIKCKKMHKI